MKYRQSGFSLIEVLVASLIMFISLTVFTSVFRGALISTQRASDVLSGSAAATLVLENISSQLRVGHQQREQSGEEYLLGYSFSWSAQVVKSTRPPARYFGKDLIQPEHELKVWQITLVNKDTSETFHYQDFSW